MLRPLLERDGGQVLLEDEENVERSCVDLDDLAAALPIDDECSRWWSLRVLPDGAVRVRGEALVRPVGDTAEYVPVAAWIHAYRGELSIDVSAPADVREIVEDGLGYALEDLVPTSVRTRPLDALGASL